MGQITPEYVEQMIEMAGRQEVFARANALGWSSQQPPLWVWYQICLDILGELKAGSSNALPLDQQPAEIQEASLLDRVESSGTPAIIVRPTKH